VKEMPAPWFVDPCTCPKDGQVVDGVLCYPDQSEFDTGEERPFLVTQTPGYLRPPPPEHVEGRFLRSFGRYTPCCGGRCLILAFDSNNSIWITFLLLVGPSSLWMAFVAPEIIDEFGTALVVLAVLLLISSVLFLLITWLVEPGILPHIEFEDRSDPSKPTRLRPLLPFCRECGGKTKLQVFCHVSNFELAPVLFRHSNRSGASPSAHE
jgi:hypothetical protein